MKTLALLEKLIEGHLIFNLFIKERYPNFCCIYNPGHQPSLIAISHQSLRAAWLWWTIDPSTSTLTKPIGGSDGNRIILGPVYERFDFKVIIIRLVERIIDASLHHGFQSVIASFKKNLHWLFHKFDKLNKILNAKATLMGSLN